MYKYIGSEDTALSVGGKYPGSDFTTQSFSNYIHPDIKTRRVLKVCNQVKDIKTLTEGLCIFVVLHIITILKIKLI